MIITLDDLKAGKAALDTQRSNLLDQRHSVGEGDYLIYVADSIRYATVVDLFLAGQSYRP